MYLVSPSSTSGPTPTPQPARFGPVAPSTHRAAFPAASSPPSGSDSPSAHLHQRPASLSHSHTSACDWPCGCLYSTHRSSPHKRHGITDPHGNNTNIVVTLKRRSCFSSNQNTHPVSLFPCLFFSVFFYLFGQDGQADSCTGSEAEVSMLQLWESLGGAMKEECIWRTARIQTGHTNISLLPDYHGGCIRWCMRRTRSALWFVVRAALLQLQQGKQS